MAVTPGECLFGIHEWVIVRRRGRGTARVETAGEAGEVEGDLEESGQLAEARDGMRLELFMLGHG